MSLKVGDFVFQDYRIAKVTDLNTPHDRYYTGHTVFLDGQDMGWSINKNAELFSLSSPLFVPCMHELAINKLSKKYKAFIREAIKWEMSKI